MKKLGLIINPIAGMGGRVGLKGTDGPEILAQSMALGAVPRAHERTREALLGIPLDTFKNVQLLTCPGKMGEQTLAACGLTCELLDLPGSTLTTAQDTKKAADLMARSNVDLLLFTGGDGTARDIYAAVGNSLPVLGIPAGVKIHSAVFAANPEFAGKLTEAVLQGKVREFREAEVMDIDENDYRHGRLTAHLFGYLKIPFLKRFVQRLKTGSPAQERYHQEAIAAAIVDDMNSDTYYIIGPGTTTRAVLERMGLNKTLLGVDLVYQKKLLGQDLAEADILSITQHKKVSLILTPVGGQGYLLGRGNQQISPKVLKHFGRDNITIIATAEKLAALHTRPLLLDTGDKEVDQKLSGYFRVITGYDQVVIYRVTR